MVSAASVAEIIVALGVAGPLTLVVLVAGGGLLAGFALWSILNFLSSWFPPIMFTIAGIVALIELPKLGWHYAILGVGAFLFTIFFGYVLWSGALKGPANTYNLFLSALPGQTSQPVIGAQFLAILLIAISVAIGVGISALGLWRLIDELED